MPSYKEGEESRREKSKGKIGVRPVSACSLQHILITQAARRGEQVAPHMLGSCECSHGWPLAMDGWVTSKRKAGEVGVAS